MAYIQHYLDWQNEKIFLDGNLWGTAPSGTSTDEILNFFYRKATLSYPKYFKMDLSSRLGFLASCILPRQPETENPASTGIILSTCHGSLSVDKAFEKSRSEIPSPALFVYTLPNIALGEICIYHKIKGPQVCLMEEQFNPELLADTALDFFNRKRVSALFLGYWNATSNAISAKIAWINLHKSNLPLSANTLTNVFA